MLQPNLDKGGNPDDDESHHREDYVRFVVE